MPKKPSTRFQIAPVLFWIFSGAVILCSIAIIQRSINDLPVTTGHLFLPAILGALAGILFGRGDIRLRLINHRLEESEKRFRALYQNTPAMMHSMDQDGQLLYVSQSWLDCLGYARSQVIGKSFFDFVIAPEVAELKEHHLNLLRSESEARNLRYSLSHADGREIEVSVNEVAQADGNHQFTETLAVVTDLTSHQAREEKIEKLAYYDSLTGLPNRTLLNDRLLQAIALARRDITQFGVFFFDLDRFKVINDTQGHAVGDLVLRSVAQRLRKFIREGDTFARLGGDEFVIIQADPNHDPNFTNMANRILETLREVFTVGEREFYTTASVGISVYPLDGDDPHTLLKSADTAMYVAKGRGRNNYQFFSSEMNAQAVAKSNMETDLRKSLQEQELCLHYQPQVDLETGTIVGVEALLRWSDSAGRMVPANEVIAMAEESGLIYPLGEWTLREVCRQAKAWEAEGLKPPRIAVNLSGHHIRQTNFMEHLEEILSSSGVAAEQLEIELAETSIMTDIDDVIMTLTDLKVHGIQLAIDDFGSASSSLIYLKHFPIHRIKIAQEFVRDITENPDYAAIIEAIIAMAHKLSLTVSAVGVENQEQIEFMKQRGCKEVQGTAFWPALPADRVAELLEPLEGNQESHKVIQMPPKPHTTPGD